MHHIGVNDNAVANDGVRADGDAALQVPSNDRPILHARLGSNSHAAHQRRVRCDKGICRRNGLVVVQAQERAMAANCCAEATHHTRTHTHVFVTD